MNKIWLTLLAAVLIVFAGNAGIVLAADLVQQYNAAYDAASDWQTYKSGDMAHISAKLIQKTTRVLHNENMDILKKLEEIAKLLEGMNVRLIDVEDIIDE